MTAIFIVITVTFSLIELPSLYLPWGAEFDYRILDTLFLIIAIRSIGLNYALLAAALVPWLHVMIDGRHSPISMLGFMANDILVVLFFWLIYYKFFNLGVMRGEKPSKTKKIKKVLVLFCLAPVFSSFESWSYVMVFLLMVNGIGTPRGDDTPVQTKNGEIGLNSFFHGTTIFWIFLFFAAIFLAKYLFEMFIFYLLEKRMLKISNYFYCYN